MPSVAEPLKLADGTLVHPNGKIETPGQRRPPPIVSVPTNAEARTLVLRTRRQLADLPAVPKQMHGVNVVLVYEIFGLSVDEIAVACNLTVTQVETIKASPTYTEMRKYVHETIITAESDSIRELFQQNARTAANKVAELIDHERADISLAASKDILDRAGHRPVDVHEHRHLLEGTLRIETIDRSVQMPIIDIEVDHVR